MIDLYADGLTTIVNKLTGLGTEYDSNATSQLIDTGKLSRCTLEKTFQFWQCRKVCEYKPKMMTRAWGIVESEQELPKRAGRQLKKNMNKLKTMYRSGQITANQFGGAIYVRLIDDGRKLNEPVDEATIKSVEYSPLFEYDQVYPELRSYQIDVYDPEYYCFTYAWGQNELSNQLIHKDRILRFRGAYLSPRQMKENCGWEESLITAFLQPLMQYLNANGYVSESVRSFEVLDLAINQFWEKIRDGKEEEIFTRLELVQKMLSSMRGLARDKEEDAQFLSRQYRGVAEIMEQLRTEMIAASGLTRPQFYQEHPSGLAATGESERQAEANDLLAEQDMKWGEQIEKDLRYNAIALNLNPESVYWEWQSLFTPTPIEKADIALKTAQTDKLNIVDSKIYTEEEARESHYRNKFNQEITLS